MSGLSHRVEKSTLGVYLESDYTEWGAIVNITLINAEIEYQHTH